jgi:hypothetical protein
VSWVIHKHELPQTTGVHFLDLAIDAQVLGVAFQDRLDWIGARLVVWERHGSGKPAIIRVPFLLAYTGESVEGKIAGHEWQHIGTAIREDEAVWHVFFVPGGL